MKKLILLLALLCAPVMARAQNVDLKPKAPALTTTTNVEAVMSSGTFCMGGVAITNTQPPTNVIGSTNTAHTFISIFNEDATAIIYCGDNAHVTASGTNKGIKVNSGATVVWALGMWQNWFCISDTAGKTAGICSGH
jgi:hypothetical protein